MRIRDWFLVLICITTLTISAYVWVNWIYMFLCWLF